jgi:GTP cyclohydrolase I
MSDNKCDPKLGRQIEQHLSALGLETPAVAKSRPKSDTVKSIEQDVSNILTKLGLDLSDDSLAETPKRVATMFVQEIFSGLYWDSFPKATVVSNKMQYDEMVLTKAEVKSTCEHHLLPILGTAHVAYIPDRVVLGLSKVNRIVNFFSRRPQIQERLTAQIHATLSYILGTENVAVVIDAQHMCVKTRGVEDSCSDTVTSKLGGVFKADSKLRAEFMTIAFARPRQ